MATIIDLDWLIVIPEHLLMGTPIHDFIIPPNCWIAGGAVRAWFTGKETSRDIDVFAINDGHLANFVKENNLSQNLSRSTERMDEYNVAGTPVQLIKVYSSTIRECFDKFDYYLCQFAYDGEAVLTTIEALLAVERKHLSVNKFLRGFEVDSLRRAFKYAAKGFRPCIGTIHDIARALSEVPKEDVERQAVLSPGGGKRGFIRWD